MLVASSIPPIARPDIDDMSVAVAAITRFQRHLSRKTGIFLIFSNSLNFRQGLDGGLSDLSA
jgi:hypothetical protein